MAPIKKNGRGTNPNSRKNLMQFRAPVSAETAPKEQSPVVVPAEANNQDFRSAIGTTLDMAAAHGAQWVYEVTSGKRRVPPHVTAQVVLRTLESRGHLTPPAKAPSADEESAALLAHIHRALELKQRRVHAVDVTPERDPGQ